MVLFSAVHGLSWSVCVIQFLFLSVLVAAAGAAASVFVAVTLRPTVPVLVAAAFLEAVAFRAPGFVMIVVPALVVLASLVLPSTSEAVPGRFVCRLGARGFVTV